MPLRIGQVVPNLIAVTNALTWAIQAESPDVEIVSMSIGQVRPEDLNCDYDVSTLDLLTLFANWGLCECGPPGGEPLTLEEELADESLTMADWDEYVAVMTDPASSHEDKDRYRCWMEHYINDCNKCTCFGPVSCPAPDPFS